jgi:serine/threonine protein kinase
VVAIKVLPAERMADENRCRRFVQEARAASALNHPNIVTIYEIESADGKDFIVMEYVPGKTLGTVIRQGMRLGEVLRIAIPIADAVARAHAAGVVHRDLKPANVVVGSDGAVWAWHGVDHELPAEGKVLQSQILLGARPATTGTGGR